MSNNLYKIEELEMDITDGYYQKGLDKNKIDEFILHVQNILPKLKNEELLYLLKNGNLIHKFIDILVYFKPYKINKKEIKINHSYMNELNKLNLFIEMVQDASLNEDEYLYICSRCCVDDVANYLLSNMTNEEIMKLSSESDDWNYKLFLYGNLKA